MRAVLDTNVLVSALIRGRKPRRLLKALSDPPNTLIISEAIIEEFSRVTADYKIRRYVDDDDASAFMGTLLSKATFVRLESAVKIFDDPDDEVLTTAKDGGADLIVTGDRHMIELRRFGRIRILTIDDALLILKRQKGGSLTSQPRRPRGRTRKETSRDSPT